MEMRRCDDSRQALTAIRSIEEDDYLSQWSLQLEPRGVWFEHTGRTTRCLVWPQTSLRSRDILRRRMCTNAASAADGGSRTQV